MKHYYITTWDIELQKFTPQKGIRTGPYTLWGLKRALQKLRTFGYSCDRNDPSVLVESTEPWKMRRLTKRRRRFDEERRRMKAEGSKT